MEERDGKLGQGSAQKKVVPDSAEIHIGGGKERQPKFVRGKVRAGSMDREAVSVCCAV